MSYGAWFKALPTWLKVNYCIALAAWLFGAFCVITGQKHGFGMPLAVGIFLTCVLLHTVSYFRQSGYGDGGR